VTAAPPQVAILMAVYNGAEFLPEQLDSLAIQTYKTWRLWVSDDGSTDATLDILGRYRKAWGPDKLRLLPGPRSGFQHNFLKLTANPRIKADYYAWADQDDIWLPSKLDRALKHLLPLGQEQPALYCGRTILTDRRGRDYGLSPVLDRHGLNFTNALMQSVGSGNTMIFNRAARELIAGEYPLALIAHDWWAYQVVSGCGGRLIYDREPQVRYRQHGGNLFGSNRGLFNRLSRLRWLLNGALKRNVDVNLLSLQKLSSLLTPDNRRNLETLTTLRRLRNPLQRLSRFRVAGFYRQTALEQTAVYLAVLLGKV